MSLDEKPADNGTPAADPAPDAQPESKDTIASIVRSGIEAEDKTGKAVEPPAPKAPETQPGYLKNWKTKEDAETGITNLERKLTEQANELKVLRESKQAPVKEQPVKPPAEDSLELTSEELLELQQTDPKTYLEYLKAKIQESLMENGLDGRLKPLEEQNRKLQEEKWAGEQREYESGTARDFGENYARYHEMRKDPEIVGKILRESPNGPIIEHLFNSGGAAQGIRLLFQEFERQDYRRERDARSRSTKVEAPVKSSNSSGKLNKNASIEDIVSAEIERERNK